LILIVFLGLSQTSCAENISSTHTILTDTIRINNDLKIITKTANSRNYRNIQTLNFVADYIFTELSKNCDTVYYQTYFVNGVEYKNVIGSIGTDKQERLVIGAHYDVCGDQEGADDNASGVAGVLELSRLISKERLNYRIDFVAYSLEEPPFFRTEHMGSNIHAKMLFDNQEKVKGMICLEMIGYFSDEPKSQSYPIGFLRLFYGNKGDYITVVQKFGNGKFGSQVKSLMKKQGLIRTKSFKAPSKLPGVDFSDHQNYWKYGYSAVMITNTAFYRNRNYHEKTDKMETLDLKRMALVIDEVFVTLKKLK
jgi:Zn-dependent M28 family amino/carboxypeptidase